MSSPSSPLPQALPLAPTHCPLCGDLNRCAIAQGQTPRTCWCMSTQVPPELLEQLPPHAVGQSCICATCIAAWNQRGVLRRFAR